MAILLLSQGVPMMLAGDEVLRSQRGNNNAYCQDNELVLVRLGLVETKRDMLRFVRELIALRKRHPSLRRKRFLDRPPGAGRDLPDVTWHGERLHEPPWHDPARGSCASRSPACAGRGAAARRSQHVRRRPRRGRVPCSPAAAGGARSTPPSPRRTGHRAA